MPRADVLPFFTTDISEVPSTTHPLGIRPGGEGGTTPALGVVINAVVDALSEYGVTHVEMPATSERIWRAMPVSFSTPAPNSDYLGFEASPEAIVAAAKKAEAVGFEAIFVNDHIIVDDSPPAAPWTNVYD